MFISYFFWKEARNVLLTSLTWESLQARALCAFWFLSGMTSCIYSFIIVTVTKERKSEDGNGMTGYSFHNTSDNRKRLVLKKVYNCKWILTAACHCTCQFREMKIVSGGEKKKRKRGIKHFRTGCNWKWITSGVVIVDPPQAGRHHTPPSFTAFQKTYTIFTSYQIMQRINKRQALRKEPERRFFKHILITHLSELRFYVKPCVMGFSIGPSDTPWRF